MQFICFETWSELPASSTFLFAQSQTDSMFFSREWLEDVVTPALIRSRFIRVIFKNALANPNC